MTPSQTFTSTLQRDPPPPPYLCCQKHVSSCQKHGAHFKLHFSRSPSLTVHSTGFKAGHALPLNAFVHQLPLSRWTPSRRQQGPRGIPLSRPDSRGVPVASPRSHATPPCRPFRVLLESYRDIMVADPLGNSLIPLPDSGQDCQRRATTSLYRQGLHPQIRPSFVPGLYIGRRRCLHGIVRSARYLGDTQMMGHDSMSPTHKATVGFVPLRSRGYDLEA